MTNNSKTENKPIKSLFVFILAGLFLGLLSSPAQASNSFRDVPNNHVFKNHIQWLVESGITTGYTDSAGRVTFRPSAPVLREQMAAFLYRMAGKPAVTNLPATSPFRDVSTRHNFYKEIVWLSDTGITGGYDDGTFRPSQPVLREQMAAFLYRYRNMTATPVNGSGPASFRDVPSKLRFSSEIRWLASNRITTGYDNGTFRPSQPVLREQMAAFLKRYDDLFNVPAPVPGEFTNHPTPTISGQLFVGQRLDGVSGVWTPAATNVTYQWLRDGSPIPGATSIGYTLTTSDVGAKISFQATGSRPGATDSVRISAETEPVKPLPSTNPIQRILDDTNAFRAANGKAPLKLMPEMNTVAQNWAVHLGNTCQFYHNPNYVSQLPSGLVGAGENIAGGQFYHSVVNSWINSPGHRANLLGNYTHIGIGYHVVGNCYERYYVQVFANYPNRP